MKLGSLFSGIGGFELGFQTHGFDISYTCEIDPSCKSLLEEHYPNAQSMADLFAQKSLPSVDALSAGFPCQPFSQAGKTNGLSVSQPLLTKMFALIKAMRPRPEWIVLENVPFILSVDKGSAVRFVIDNLETLGYRWAYRIVDGISLGTPQRRKRWVLVASRNHDTSFLFEDSSESRSHCASSFGFYWTEGNTGVGWAQDAVPPLKVGSSYGIPSLPAFWDVKNGTFATPSIEDAERLQGFPQEWTLGAQANKRGQRLRMVGNAVNPMLASWIAARLVSANTLATRAIPYTHELPLPRAATGYKGKRYTVECSDFVSGRNRTPLLQFLKHPGSPLSLRAAKGFLSRARASTLRFQDGFLDALDAYTTA